MSKEMLEALMEYATATARYEIAAYADREWAASDRLERAEKILREINESEKPS